MIVCYMMIMGVRFTRCGSDGGGEEIMSKSSYPGSGGSTVLLGLAGLMIGVFAGYSIAAGKCQRETPAPVPSVSVTSTVRGMLQGTQLPPCAHEDGNRDGQPCVWADPATGRVDVVDSAEYR